MTAIALFSLALGVVLAGWGGTATASALRARGTWFYSVSLVAVYLGVTVLGLMCVLAALLFLSL